MSLLLDALKKAEKAKEIAKRRGQVADGSDADATVMQVRTRNELPDISGPLEIHSEDIPGGIQMSRSDSPVPDAFSTPPVARPAKEAAAPISSDEPAVDSPPRRRQAATSAESASDPQAAQRAAAKNVFEAKFKEPNPKLPFQIVMVLLGVFALGTVVYFWYQLRPPPALVNTNAKLPPNETKVEGGQIQPSTTQSSPQGPAQGPAVPGLPGQLPSAAAPVAPAVAGAGAAQPATAAPASSVKPGAPQGTLGQPRDRTTGPSPRQPGAAQTTRAPADPSKLSVNRAAPEVNAKLEAGWLAYNQGNLEAARSSYQDMLRDEPANRDALLGMAAIEVRTNRREQAEIHYQQLLDANPRDAHAHAGLLALRAPMTDPVQAESRIKNLLASDPEAHFLYFTLGNQYAQQGRWPEAQQAYFKAFSADPENPDFAYNLAVSLDQVRQPKLALEYYRRAISLAQQRSSSFGQALARNRAQELAR